MKSRDDMLAFLKAKRPIIAPSMLKCDFSDLRSEIQRIDEAQLPLYHWDVMDGHFVPNLSYGAMVISEARQRTETPFDAHLMISNPATYLESFLNAGCEAITFHFEAVTQPETLLRQIRSHDRVAGLAVNPDTAFEDFESLLPECDLLLVMSVNPGFGGQAFMPAVLPKVRSAREVAGEDLVISMDGGIASGTIGLCAEAGVDVFVAGSSIFDHEDYSVAGQQLIDEASASYSAA